MQISIVEPLIHRTTMHCLVLVLPEAGKIIWGYLQYYLRDDRVVVNNAGYVKLIIGGRHGFTFWRKRIKVRTLS